MTMMTMTMMKRMLMFSFTLIHFVCIERFIHSVLFVEAVIPAKSEWYALQKFSNSISINGKPIFTFSKNGDCSDYEGIQCDEFGKVIKIISRIKNLTGTLTKAIGNFSSLSTLDLQDNLLQGKIPSSIKYLNSLKIVRLSLNKFEGKISEDFCSLLLLEELRLHSNNFIGTIPKCFEYLIHLKDLDLSNNNFNGKILSTLSKSTSLMHLVLSKNKFIGSIPSSIGNLILLRQLHLQNNNFFGFVPKQIVNLTQLIELKLNNNNFSGNVPLEIIDLKNLVELDLSNNYFSGEILNNIFKLSSILYIDLSLNNFFGNFPKILPPLLQLKYLSLHNNQFSGKLPRNFDSFPKLKYLILGNNYFYGFVPLTILNSKNVQFENQTIFPNNYTSYNFDFQNNCLKFFSDWPKKDFTQKKISECKNFCDLDSEFGPCYGRGSCFFSTFNSSSESCVGNDCVSRTSTSASRCLCFNGNVEIFNSNACKLNIKNNNFQFFALLGFCIGVIFIFFLTLILKYKIKINSNISLNNQGFEILNHDGEGIQMEEKKMILFN